MLPATGLPGRPDSSTAGGWHVHSAGSTVQPADSDSQSRSQPLPQASLNRRHGR